MGTFSALPTLCLWNSPVTDEFLSQRSVTRNFDIFVDLRLNKWLNKHSKFEIGDFGRHHAHYNVTIMEGRDPREQNKYEVMIYTDAL